MNCKKVQELLSAYIDNECTNEEQEFIKSHLKTCKNCTDEYNLIREIVKITNELDELDVPDGFHDDLMNKIHEMSPNLYFSKLIKFYQNTTRVAAIFIFVIMVTAISTVMSLKLNDPLSYGNMDGLEYSTGNSEIENNITYNQSSHEIDKKAASRGIDELENGTEELENETKDLAVRENASESSIMKEDSTLEDDIKGESIKKDNIENDSIEENANISLFAAENADTVVEDEEIEFKLQQGSSTLQKIMKILSVIGIGAFITLSIGFIITYFYKIK